MGVFGSHQKQTEGSTTNTSSTASFSIVFNRFSACDSFPSFFSKRCCTYDLHHDCMVRSALVNAPVPLLATPPAPRYASAGYRPRKSLACPSPWNVLVCVHRNVLSGKVRVKVANGLRAPRVTTRITRRPKTLATACGRASDGPRRPLRSMPSVTKHFKAGLQNFSTVALSTGVSSFRFSSSGALYMNSRLSSLSVCSVISCSFSERACKVNSLRCHPYCRSAPRHAFSLRSVLSM